MASLFELLGSVNWSDLEGKSAKESGLFEYSSSKIEIIMFVRELNKRLRVSYDASSLSHCLILCWRKKVIHCKHIICCVSKHGSDNKVLQHMSLTHFYAVRTADIKRNAGILPVGCYSCRWYWDHAQIALMQSLHYPSASCRSNKAQGACHARCSDAMLQIELLPWCWQSFIRLHIATMSWGCFYATESQRSCFRAAAWRYLRRSRAWCRHSSMGASWTTAS
jgi:hypothetical protein